MSKRYIIYACPTGNLADQLAAYFMRSRELCGPNSAHDYMPHCSLTGFFSLKQGVAARWATTVQDLLPAMLDSMPKPPVQIVDMVFRRKIHCLELHSEWLMRVTSKIISTVEVELGPMNAKKKGDLHLSLAYGFDERDAPRLQRLATDTICIESRVGWNLRCYSRDENKQFECLLDQQLA